MKIKETTQRAFTLIELLVVITIIAILASMAMPAYNKITERAKITKDVNNIKQILLACRTFSADNDGIFPAYDPEEPDSEKFGTSTEAWNALVPDYVDTESIFWIQTQNPDKLRPPAEDDDIEQEENTYTYVVGQTDTTFSRSPLVADEQDGAGTYGEYHPWLESKKAVIGYCGGQVVEERLTSNEAGATVTTKDRLIEDIFQKREKGSDGGGLLAVDADNILNP